MCYATLDTDAIGSCRLPAACCGVVGFKGTYSIISSVGILDGEAADEMILRLAHPGIITRSVEDTALMLDVLAERKVQTDTDSFFDGLAKGTKLRIGVANNFKADQEVLKIFEKAIEMIRSLGHPISTTAVPFDFGDLSQGVGDIETARKTIAGHLFKDIDILLLPTCSTTVPSIEDAAADPQALSPEQTVFANYYGLPSVSVPCGFDRKGLPLGLQVISRPWDDAAVLQLAHQYQMAAKYDRKHPIA
jgi:aspartyl-tRNA(Asn)/glutamyl-tRNA(Gln) amidotransferase subunit A